jgi:hypothetical protein
MLAMVVRILLFLILARTVLSLFTPARRPQSPQPPSPPPDPPRPAPHLGGTIVDAEFEDLNDGAR